MSTLWESRGEIFAAHLAGQPVPEITEAEVASSELWEARGDVMAAHLGYRPAVAEQAPPPGRALAEAIAEAVALALARR